MPASNTTTLLGVSGSFNRFLDDVHRVARTETSVLLCGETGTGKDLIARTIHGRSRRRKGPFVPVDCASMAEDLLDSELFGHSQDAFTGATSSRRGRFQSAHGGTLFLDGIDHLPATGQVKLLRAIQEKEITPLGSSRARPVDFRLVTSVSQDFPRRLECGAFRHDLYFRVNIVRLELPPLRDRDDDIPILAEYFLAQTAERFGKPICRLGDAALRVIRDYSWPGNVRELAAVIECAVASARGEIVRESDLPVYLRSPPQLSESSGPPAPVEASPQEPPVPSEGGGSFAERVDDFQRRLLVESISRNGWDYRACGRELSLTRHQLKYLCAKLGVRRPRMSDV